MKDMDKLERIDYFAIAALLVMFGAFAAIAVLALVFA